MVEVGGKGEGEVRKDLFYKLLDYFPIVVRPRNNGHKLCFFLCSSPSLPSYLYYFTERAGSWSEQHRGLCRVVPTQFPLLPTFSIQRRRC